MEVHAVNAGDEGGWDADDGDDGQYLDQAVLRDVDEAECGIQQELHFVGQVRAVFVERGDVLLYRIQPVTDRAGEPVRRGGGVGGEAGDAELAVAQEGDGVVVPAQHDEHGLQIGLCAALAGAAEAVVENLVREIIQLGAQALQRVRLTVHDGLQQPGEKRGGGGVGHDMRLRWELGENDAGGEAQGNEPCR